MRKKILTAGLSFALLLGAVGCGNASASNTETDNTEAAKVEEVTEEVTEASEEETKEATEEAEKEVNEKDIVAESNASATDSTYVYTLHMLRSLERHSQSLQSRVSHLKS